MKKINNDEIWLIYSGEEDSQTKFLENPVAKSRVWISAKFAIRRDCADACRNRQINP